MALFNEILVGRINRGLTKILSIKGQAPAPQLTAEINPEIRVEDFLAAEHRFQMQVQRWGVAQVFAAVAAQTWNTRLRNPVGSGVIASIESIELNPGGVAMVLQVSANQLADLTGGSSPVGLDQRQPGTSSLHETSQQGAGITPQGGSTKSLTFPANAAPFELILNPNQEIAVVPGWAIDIGTTTANAAGGINIVWRERPLEASEAF